MKNKKILLTGHNGLVGSSIHRNLLSKGYKDVITIDKSYLNLLNQTEVFSYLSSLNPDAVIIAAAKVGGILANSNHKASFIYENLTIQNNLIHGSYLAGVKNLLFLGTSCCYPKLAYQPIKEESLLTGPLEITNEPYAVAKIAGIKMCQSYKFQYNLNYKSLMPCNLFGPGDNYDLTSSHFLPAIISKIHLAKKKKLDFVDLWGSGKPLREIMYVDDIANAVEYFLFKEIDPSFINIGSGIEYSILNYAKIISRILEYDNLKFILDDSKPDGTPRKLLDSSKANKLGWVSKFTIEEGIKLTYKDFLDKEQNSG